MVLSVGLNIPIPRFLFPGGLDMAGDASVGAVIQGRSTRVVQEVNLKSWLAESTNERVGQWR